MLFRSCSVSSIRSSASSGKCGKLCGRPAGTPTGQCRPQPAACFAPAASRVHGWHPPASEEQRLGACRGGAACEPPGCQHLARLVTPGVPLPCPFPPSTPAQVPGRAQPGCPKLPASAAGQHQRQGLCTAAQAPSSGAQAAPQLTEACQEHHHSVCRFDRDSCSNCGGDSRQRWRCGYDWAWELCGFWCWPGQC
jgi:hypothetical protein